MGERIRQQYHLEPDRGLLNDPNGLCWFNGKYHIFFQWNRFAKDHSYKEWGLFTSKDLIHWEFGESALLPDQEYDKNGVYSGSGYVIGDSLYLFYTGNSKNGRQRKSSQCLAVTKDSRVYIKKGVVLETPEEYTEHFRDPKVFKTKEHGYYMVVGGQQKNGKGALALCSSEDGREWKYWHMLAASEQFEMIECPDLFELNGQEVLLYNPQHRDNEKDEDIFSFSVYKLEEFDEQRGTLKDKKLDIGYVKTDAGFDFYAPQTFEAPDGRRILFGWMSRMGDQQERIFSENEPNIHCLTLPRELSVRGKKLCQKPIRELYGLLGEKIPMVHDQNRWKAQGMGHTFYLHIQSKEGEQDKDIEVGFHHKEAGIIYQAAEKKLIFYRRNWTNGMAEEKTEEIGALRELEIWSDHSSMEIFVNEGQTVFSSRIYPQSSETEIILEGNVQEKNVRICKINNTKKGEE